MNGSARVWLVRGALLVVLMVPAALFWAQQLRENRLVEQYLRSHDLHHAQRSVEAAHRVADQVRADFNIDISTFDALDLNNRPFLRESTLFLLTHKEGVCGEGTRVIINLLSHLGYNAARLSLYDQALRSKHTLVSVELNGEEFLVDSINPPSGTTRLLKQRRISTADFELLRYSESTINPEYDGGEDTVYTDPDMARFMERFWLYSYETLPVSKLLSALGLDMRAFTLARPPRWLAILAERPLSIYAIASGIGGLLILLLLELSGAVRWLAGRFTGRTGGARAPG